MSVRAVRVDTTTEGTIVLRLDRPPGNVLGIDLCRQLRQEIATAADDPAAKLLVVASEGEHFSFGASVEEHLPEQAEEMLAAMGELVGALYSHPYPTLAAIRGRCLGGGFEVALACDMLVAEESSIMAAPEIRLGVFAPAATVLLQAGVPRCVAAEVLLTGRDLSAAEALQFGLINRVVADGTLCEAVVEFASAFVQRHSAPSPAPGDPRVAPGLRNAHTGATERGIAAGRTAVPRRAIGTARRNRRHSRLPACYGRRQRCGAV